MRFHLSWDWGLLLAFPTELCLGLGAHPPLCRLKRWGSNPRVDRVTVIPCRDGVAKVWLRRGRSQGRRAVIHVPLDSGISWSQGWQRTVLN